MGARVIRKVNSPEATKVRRRKEALTVWAIVGAIALPVLLASILMGIDMRSDLSELRPSKQLGDPLTALIGWPDLDGGDGHAVEIEHAGWQHGGQPWQRVKMLGYMMDGYGSSPDGTQLPMFILLPEAGQFMHPAHRIPNEMVEVWVRRPIAFKFRDLVWASGTLQRTRNSPRSGLALYAMRDAEVETAEQRDITRWFEFGR